MLVVRESALVLGRVPGAHTCDAALDAAVGGRFRIVIAILPDEVRSLRSVFSMPPFFSGLGVRARPFSFSLSVLGGVSVADVVDWRRRDDVRALSST